MDTRSQNHHTIYPPSRLSDSNEIGCESAWPIHILRVDFLGDKDMPKFDFSVITRDGQSIESIQIFGVDLPDAERKLRQMYRNCEVTNCKPINSDKRFHQSIDIENVLTLIAKDSED